MDKVFANFHMDTEFFILMSLFFAISFLITIIIVYFLTRINALNTILEQAKEIDEAKIAKISLLENELQEERTKSTELSRELLFIQKNEERLKEALKTIESLQGELKEDSKAYTESMHRLKIDFKQLSVHYELLNNSYTKLQESHEKLQDRNEELVNENNSFHTQLRESKVRIVEQEKQNIEKIEMMKEHRVELKKEFEQLASKIFDGNSKEFTELSQKGLSNMIKPLESQIDEFKKQVQTFYSDESKDRAMLKQEILSLKDLNRQISQDAINLTNALKGEKKQQGIWGEMILEKVLESSGLRKGIEYTREVSLRNSNGKSYRPDVLVHLPDKRDLIIDAKTSLNAYEKYISSENSKELHLNRHVKALRNHIKDLSGKNYEKLLGINTLDFIFMFVPIEGALAVALEHDSSLYDDAFKKQILLVGPTTLLIAMRAIENVWKHEKQNQNAKEIASRAGALYDKFVSFSDDMVKISKQFEGLHGSFESAKKRLSEGRGNIIRQVEQLKEMGAKTKKQIPKEMSS
ncbi:DNA recombination protein RmuC [hydrothermal vent metagenome]|uniref:DNA recombination protein RmuC n=1 Tax=hydrothermal vent metagenome TaxID=652676 RepID=A0A1W1C7U6_9ZZZZ